MRLTLRTLLAYLDNILDPEDHQELEQKINDSEVAHQLVQRIRDQTISPQASVPPVLARGMGGDANSVAEYLDNTLPAERVPDFERVCLESDVHLSEVAACHQILALVLGAPADVDLALRRRLYHLEPAAAKAATARGEGDVAEPAAATAEGPAGRHIDVAAPGQEPSSQSEPLSTSAQANTAVEHSVPTGGGGPGGERSTWWLMGVAAALAIILVTAGLLLLGPLDRTHPLARLWFGSPQQQAAREDSSATATIADDQAAPTPLAPTVPPDSAVASDGSTGAVVPEPAETAAGQDHPAAEVRPELEPAPDNGSAPTESPVGRTTELGVSNTGADQTPRGDEGTTVGSTTTATGRSDSAPSTSPDSASRIAIVEGESSVPTEADASRPGVRFAPGEPEGPEPEGPVEALAPSDRTPADNASSASTTEPDSTAAFLPAYPDSRAASTDVVRPPAESRGAAANGEAASAPPAEPAVAEVDVGRYISEKDLLVRWDSDQQQWTRLLPRAPLKANDRFVALPAYRPQIMLASGVQLTIPGGSQFTLGTPEVGIALDFGRILVTAVEADTSLHLALGNRRVMIALAEPNTSLAIEVKPVRLPGTDPREAPPHQVARIMVLSGSASLVDDQGQNPQAIPNGQQLVLADQGEPVMRPIGEPEPWFDGHEISGVDRLAARDLEPHVSPDRPVTLALQERAEFRRVEIRSLAARCLAYLGQFGPVVAALNDEMQRGTYWSGHLEVLQALLATSPTAASAIYDVLQTRHGPEADALYRMLWGYSPDDLEQGADAELVEYLNHASLDYRVVAYETLRSITGVATLYRPELDERDRRSKSLRWQQMLEAGEIRWKERMKDEG